jgi:hypothetical protein
MPATLTQLSGGYSLATSSRATTSAAGTNEDSLVIPAGFFFVLLSLRATHADTVARTVEFFVDDGTDVYASPSPSSAVRTSVAPAPDGLTWDGKLYLPAGWRVGVRMYAMVVGKTISWQATAIQCAIGGSIL